MKTRLRSHFIVCIAIGAIVGCDGDGVESAEGRQVGALGSVTTLGSSGPYTGGLASSSAINPSGLGSSPWAPDASVSDCSDACGMLFLCFPDETDDLDDCLAGCAAAIEDGDAVAATSIGCVARSPTCAAAAQCLEEAYGDSPGDALGNGLGVPSGDGAEAEASAESAMSAAVTVDRQESAGSRDSSGDDAPARNPTPSMGLDCDGACDRMFDCFGDSPMPKSECLLNCALADSQGDPGGTYTCIADALACQDFLFCEIPNI